MSFYGFLKKLALLILIMAIAIPIRYGSTNYQYVILRFVHSLVSLKHSLVPDQARPTLSADYRAFESIVRMKPILTDDPLSDPLTIAKKIRPICTISNVVPKPSDCQVDKEVFEHDGHTVDTYWVDYSGMKLQKNSDKLLLFLHGGAYVLGDVHSELFCTFQQKATIIFIYFNRL
jgi:acetyl esterase/lipase